MVEPSDGPQQIGAPDPKLSSRAGSALRVGLLYLLFGAGWILLTDNLLPRMVDVTGPWQTYKGLLFVLLSAGVIYVLVRRELHARRLAERHREAYQRRYQALFEQNVAGVFRTTVDGEILDCNQALAELLGYERPEEVVGTDAATHYADPDQREVWIEELRDDRLVRNFELHLRRRDGSDVWALMNAGLIEEEETRGPLLAGTMVDVTEEKQLRDELEAYAYHDSLTGLPNRRYLKEEALAVLSKARRDGAVVALLYLDLNRFKRINDTLGHDAGDDLLFQVGRRLERHVREEDLAARIGGDEFAVLLNTIDDIEGARNAASRLHEKLSDPFFVAERSLHVDTSVGVAVYPDHGGTFADLLSHADQAMYQSFQGTASITVYQPTSGQRVRDQLAEEEDLRQALLNDQFELHYQPIYQIADHTVVGAEALMRWNHPELGLRRPGSFIPVAEMSGLIRELDLWAVKTALDTAERLATDGPLDWCAVNVSAQSLGHDDVLGRFQEWLEASELRPGSLVIEVTESTAMQDPRGATQVFRNLQDRGARVAIDDFGTGHSALAYLKNLPVDLVKLDMIFVRGIEAGQREDRLLRALIELGRTLEVVVVAEGVERERQYSRLAEHRCDLAQGSHLGQPVMLEELSRNLSRD